MFKAIGGARFSFMVFGGAQVLMDVEPLVRIIREDSVLHGPSHTIPGAMLIGLASGLLGKPISEGVLRLTGMGIHRINWSVSFASAFIGTFSHIGLDAIMHADMNPLSPLVQGNGMLGLISVETLHVACLAAAAVAGGACSLRAVFSSKKQDAAR